MINEIDNDLTLTRLKLNWEVSKEKLISENNKPSPHYGIYRDTKYIATVGKDYTIVQNKQLLEYLLQASNKLDFDFGNIVGGHMDSTLVYLQLTLPNISIGKDTLLRKLTMLNSHDGSTSVGLGNTDTVVSCQNTFFLAYKDLTKIRHYASSLNRIDDVVRNLNQGFLNGQEITNTYLQFESKLLTKGVNIDTIYNLVTDLVGITKETYLIAKEGKEVKASKKSILLYSKILECIKTETNTKGMNYWGLFNGITFYYNHVDSSQSTYFAGLKKNKMEYAYEYLKHRL